MNQLLLLALLLPTTCLAQALTNNGATLTVEAGALLYVAGSVQNAPGSTLTNAGTVQLTGDLANAGTLTAPGTLLFSGSQDQTFTPGLATVGSLTVRNTGGVGANRLFISGDLTVTSLLTFTQGLLRTQGPAGGSPLATLRLPDGARVVGEAAGQYVQGRLAVTRADVSGSTGPVDFTNGLVLAAGGPGLGAVTVTRTAGLQLAGVSYGQNVGGAAQGIDRVWQVAAAQQPSAARPASATVSWVADDDNGFNPAQPAQLWRADQVAGPWEAQGTPASARARSLTASVTRLGVLTVSTTGQPLPVTLVDFSAQPEGPAAVRLRWATASELNNAGFTVERSVDGHAFSAVGTVAGAGTSAVRHDYALLDARLPAGASLLYYRLAQLDVAGTLTYSPVRTVALAPAEAAFVVYPTHVAVNQEVAYRYSGPAGAATIQVLDALGRAVRTLSVSGATEGVVPLAGLAAGPYLLRYATATASLTTRCVVQ